MLRRKINSTTKASGKRESARAFVYSAREKAKESSNAKLLFAVVSGMAPVPSVAAFTAEAAAHQSARPREDLAVDHVLSSLEASSVIVQNSVNGDVEFHVLLAEAFAGERRDEEARGLKSCRLDQCHDFERPLLSHRHLCVQLDVISFVDPRADSSDAEGVRNGRGVAFATDAKAEVLTGSEDEDGLVWQSGIRYGAGLLAWTEVEGVGRIAPLVKVLHGDERSVRWRRRRLRAFWSRQVLDLQVTPSLAAIAALWSEPRFSERLRCANDLVLERRRCAAPAMRCTS